MIWPREAPIAAPQVSPSSYLLLGRGATGRAET